MVEIRDGKKVLITPISREDLNDIHIGDIIYLDGDLTTCRDVAHRRLVEEGRPLPVDVRDCAILHAGPIIRPLENDKFEMVSVGPTTSMRMEKFEKEFVEQIEQTVMSFDKIKGIHDLIVHDYGPGRVMVSLHAEVDGKEDIYELHDIIDNAEKRLENELGCLAVIHMDPIEADNETTNKMKEEVLAAVQEINSEITIHDFRMVPGKSHTNLIFDIVVPYSVKESDSAVKEMVLDKISEKFENCFAVINVDRPFVSA